MAVETIDCGVSAEWAGGGDVIISRPQCDAIDLVACSQQATLWEVCCGIIRYRCGAVPHHDHYWVSWRGMILGGASRCGCTWIVSRVAQAMKDLGVTMEDLSARLSRSVAGSRSPTFRVGMAFVVILPIKCSIVLR